MLASPLALSAVVGCLGWPSRPANPQRVLGPVDAPILVINSRHDPATAYLWAQRVAAQLGPRARLVTYEGSGHVVYGRSACVTGAVDTYLIEARTPPAGTSCPGVPPDPFGVGGG
jgi:pimeloyl-ACP methyl ester carboxylesterase